MTTPNDTTIPTKTCNTCLIEYPNTTTFFAKKSDNLDSLNKRCKTCVNAYSKAHYEANKERKAITSAAWYQANKEQHAANGREWHKANPDAARRNTQAYRQRNPEHAKAVAKRYSDNNRQLYRDCAKQWRKANPEKVKAMQHKGRIARRARIAASDEHFTAADLRLQYKSQRGKCWHCGVELNNVYEPDHLIPLAQGGTNAPNNIVCSCKPCNRSKGGKTVAQWKGMFV